jgi:hypothetical protein
MVDSVKARIKDIVFVQDSISKSEIKKSRKEKCASDIDVTSPEFRAGYSMAYDMANFRLNNLMKDIDSLPIG